MVLGLDAQDAWTMWLVLRMLLELQDGDWTIDKRFYYVASTKGGYQDYRWVLGLQMLLEIQREYLKVQSFQPFCLGLGQAKPSQSATILRHALSLALTYFFILKNNFNNDQRFKTYLVGKVDFSLPENLDVLAEVIVGVDVHPVEGPHGVKGEHLESMS